MASMGMQVLGIALSVIGWLASILCCALPMWRETAFVGNNIVVAQIIWEGLWMSCVVQSTGQMQCKVYDSLLALPQDLQAARAMLVVAIVLAILGTLLAVAGGKCTNCVEDDTAKAKVMILSGIIFIVAGILILIPISWSANSIVQDFYNPLVSDSQKRDLGSSLYVGWAASALLCPAGGTCPPKAGAEPPEPPEISAGTSPALPAQGAAAGVEGELRGGPLPSNLPLGWDWGWESQVCAGISRVGNVTWHQTCLQVPPPDFPGSPGEVCGDIGTVAGELAVLLHQCRCVTCIPSSHTPRTWCFHPFCIPSPWCSLSLNSQGMDCTLPLCRTHNTQHIPSGTQQSHASTSQGHGAPTLVTFPFLLVPIPDASGFIHRGCSGCSSHLSSASSSPLSSPTNHIHTPSSWTSLRVPPAPFP
uniref:Claudin 4 n=1 Tax=Cyanistes caeruleus TaxID=156563 RepID=A0A8C0U484_CYACU